MAKKKVMTTSNKAAEYNATKGIRLNVRHDRKPIYLYIESDESYSLSLALRGDRMKPGDFFACFDKGEARRIRKEIHAEGFPQVAAAPRNAN